MCRASTYKRVLKLGTNSNFQSRDLTTILCCVITSYTHYFGYICAVKHSIYLELLRVKKTTNRIIQHYKKERSKHIN